MSGHNHKSPVTFAYAQALLELANEANSAPATGEELRAVRQIIEANADFAQILSDPAIGTLERGQLIHRTFDGRASLLLLHFLGLVNEKGRLNLLPAMSAAYDDLLDRQQGKMEVDITVAEQLNPQELDAVRLKVGASLRCDPVIRQNVDPSIIGGVVLRLQDQIIDGSIKAQLQAMKRRLLAARPT